MQLLSSNVRTSCYTLNLLISRGRENLMKQQSRKKKHNYEDIGWEKLYAERMTVATKLPI